jgi:starch-binding outer membrane protein, SusD/RagB family
MHQHSWTPNNNVIRDVWRELTQGVARAAGSQQFLTNINGPARFIAEARALGAFYNLYLLDLYGVVLVKRPEEVGTAELSKVLRGAEAVNHLLEEFDAVEPTLGTRADVGTTRLTKAAIWGLKARLLLNKTVYINRYAPTFAFDNGDMAKVIDLTTRIMNAPGYQLETNNYFSIWNVGNKQHREHIFAYDQRRETSGSNRHAWFGSSRSRHGSLTNILAVGSDGVSLTTGFYNRWEGNRNDPRYFQRNLPDGGSVADKDFKWNRGIQVGQQYGAVLDGQNRFKRTSDGELVIEKLVNRTRTGEDVVYTVEVDLNNNRGHSQGPRAFKIDFDPAAVTGQCCSVIDIPILRMGEIILNRAEAYLRSGNAAAALADINTLRAARKASELSSLNLETMYLERQYEMYVEMQARTDAIRFNKWELTWIDKTSTNPIRRLFPIPRYAIDAASSVPGYLTQNQGY